MFYSRTHILALYLWAYLGDYIMKKQPCPHWKKENKNLCEASNKQCFCDGNMFYCDYPKERKERK